MLKHVRYDNTTGRFKTALPYVDEDFNVGGGGQANFDVTEPFFAATTVSVEVNGVEARESVSYDYTRNVSLNRIEFTYTVPQNAWVRIRVYT